ncbi:hypothetical protein MGYG_04008 [Nannizzia gypsea CBS 118893]|uniref:Zn(2)-C6 fungal-type domain-containing protein n=1 Tax=Arthroderma gypseum (strain ATCC MYA-4604 / CBS 118893) TaxID=535722 RepID=E4UUN9_ARTGP|nr:hypothetical protein MGYG_04008 [Nannizzia gypsea CBS 118893]EFR01006.1 hypothetical protein MGYG_04008 [Nannizzia gypsea CBS 118893]
MALEPKPLSSRKRQACDRCHGQKLRCMRAQQSPGPCQRCLLAKKECTFSYRLQMGRPRAPAPTASPWTETVWNLEDLDKLNAADQEEGHIPMEDTFLDMFGKICPIPPETSKDSGSGSENDPLTMSNQTQEDVFNESRENKSVHS